jgi:hypothetical protein
MRTIKNSITLNVFRECKGQYGINRLEVGQKEKCVSNREAVRGIK